MKNFLQPPPNVTGALHIGHALNSFIQRTLSLGFTLFCHEESQILPGLDHGGISTEISAKKQGAKSFKDIEQFADKCKSKILDQLKILQIPMAMDKLKYTMDEDHKKLVEDTFINLYERKLIYRDWYIVNFDTKLKTAISDLEVDYETIDSFLYFIPYKIVGLDEDLLVATTRPETIFADSALALHPSHYKENFRKALIPILNKEIPIIYDESIDPDFGTGVLKVTPAHSLVDYKLGKKHNLEFINIIDENNKLYNVPDDFLNLTVMEAREKISSLAVKIEKISQKIPKNMKSGGLIEYRLTQQWFLKLDSIKEQAKNINITPSNWKKFYDQWLDNVHDWCISRSILWGHEIPAYYNEKKEIFVGKQAPDKTWIKTTEVLDTWFSSALWPRLYEITFNLKTDTIVTAYDILFFWIAKTALMNLLVTNELPFKNIVIHRLVRDGEGQKMSKTKGNVLDPLELLEKFSLGAFCLSLLGTISPNRNILFSEKEIEHSEHILTKLKNFNKYITLNMHKKQYDISDKEMFYNFFMHKTIEAIDKFTNAIRNYEIHHMMTTAVDFLYFTCDWALEIHKKSFYKVDLNYMYEILCKMFHVLAYVDYDKTLNDEKKSLIKSEHLNKNLIDKGVEFIEFVEKIRSLSKIATLEISSPFKDLVENLTKIPCIFSESQSIKILHINEKEVIDKIQKNQIETEKLWKFFQCNMKKIPQSLFDEKIKQLNSNLMEKYNLEILL